MKPSRKSLNKIGRKLRDIARRDASFQHLAEQHADGLLVVDGKDSVLWANGSARALLHAESLKGKTVDFGSMEGEPADIELADRHGIRFLAEVRRQALTWEGEKAFLIQLRRKSARDRTRESLKKHGHRLRSILTASPLAIVVLDSSYRVTSWSRAAAELFGVDEADVIGQSLPAYACSQGDCLVQLCQDVYETGQPIRGTALSCLRTHGGKSLNVRAWISMIQATDINPGSYLLLLADITTEQHLVEELTEAEKKLAHIMRAGGHWCWELDTDLCITYVSNTVQELLGWKEQELLGRSVLHFIPESEHESIRIALATRESEHFHLPAHTIITRDGRPQVFDADITALTDTAGQVAGYYGISRNISERRALEEMFMESNEKFSRIFHSIPDPVMIASLPQGVLLEINEGFTALCGHQHQEAIGRTTMELGMWAQPQARNNFIRELETRGKVRNFEFIVRHRDGSTRICLMAADRLTLGGQPCHIAILRDITDFRILQQQVIYVTRHDQLTGLANREKFMEQVSLNIRQAQRTDGQSLAVIQIGIDHFGKLNQSLGRHMGDVLLKLVAERIIDSIFDIDLVARIGGDEFAVLINSLDEARNAARAASRILKRLSEPFHLPDQSGIHIKASLGISVFPESSEDTDTLLHQAATAMHRSKEAGGHCFHFFSTSMNDSVTERFRLESELYRALEEGELEIHYQPLFSLKTGTACGVEALARWRHPDRGMISPAVFIPIAEESGLIATLGSHVLRQACHQIADWLRRGAPPMKVSVNVSPRQFELQDLPGVVEEALALSGLDPRLLVLELTESTFLRDTEDLARTLDRLRAIGVSIAIDDFGTGYSSLSYLKQLPVDTLKIDKSFVADMDHESDGSMICSAIIALAHRLGLKVTAEGVETPQQLAILADLHCDVIQGYLMSPPLPEDQCLACLLQPESLMPRLPEPRRERHAPPLANPSHWNT